MRHRFLVILCFCFATSVSAQLLDYRQGEVIVQFGADVDAKGWITSKVEFTDYRSLGYSLNAYLLTYDFDQYAYTDLRQRYWPDPAVIGWQQNHLVRQRARPNDLRYDDQWQLRNTGQLAGVLGADHNVEPAWDITTGGVTVNGDTIVVAILDDGVDTDHEDLIRNLWRNHDEIPNNGIDDDNNGYTDDFFGWNTAGGGPGDGNVDAGEGNHGTPVAGLIGASGNNNLGVAGTNWNVKLMIIRNNFASSEAEVIQAYSYALEAREAYDETNGAEGAYVVATNASWGRPFGLPEESPIWCMLYDRLGSAGILNAGATENANYDVEEEGDLPSLCPSDHLVVVTNLNTFDQKVRAAAYSSQSVDLGAYGDDVFTTNVGNTYGRFMGTSSATPGVAGAIALLYATPCEAFGELLLADPATATLRVRSAILSGVTPNASLDGITVTGGRLNVKAAMDDLLANFSSDGMASCDACLPPSSFSVIPSAGSATALTVDWRATASLEDVALQYRPAGTQDWTTIPQATAPYEISGLSACLAYELQVSGRCGTAAAASEVITISTDGCCLIPEDFMVTALPNQIFSVNWTELLAGRSYRVRYRPQGDSTWLTRTSRSGSLFLAGNLSPCTNYEFEFQTDCDTLVTDFGNRTVVLSFGCGACNEVSYCTPQEFDNEREWIQEVNLGNILVQRSGPEEDGYRSYGEVTQRPFVRGGDYPITITPDFDTGTGVDGFRVYVDWDQNGIFSESEVAAEMNNSVDAPAKATITIPEDAELLLTRMRVLMQFQGVNDDCPVNRGFGEAEDYCINIGPADASCSPPPVGGLRIAYDATADLTRLAWQSSNATGGTYRIRYRLRDSMDDWVETDVEGIELTINDLNLCGAYEFEIASLCAGTPGRYQLFYFNDNCTGTRNNRIPAATWSVFPNPAVSEATVRWEAGLRPASLTLYDLNGRLLQQLTTRGRTAIPLPLAGYASGLYLLRLQTEDGRVGVRRVVVK